MTAARSRPTLMVLLSLLLLSGAAGAQFQSGSLYGTVTDTDGHPLEGVHVSLEGVGGPHCKTTDARGHIRFLGLDPGNYRLTAEFEGFSRVVYEQVAIRIGRNATLQLQMSAVLEETITVTTEPPLIDASDFTRDITVTEFELDEIPTTRDPWAVVGQTPGVVVDRVNVGGSESGQQALFVGNGTASRENAYVVDGVNITDMAAIGATPAYYDFDQLGEMQVSTGGAEASTINPGVTLNLVTKRGGNEFRGSARLYHTDESWQSSPNVDLKEFAPGQSPTTTNRLRGMQEYGLEGGGPLRRDHVWFWGAYAKSDIDRLTLGGTPDDIVLTNGALKLNFQASEATSGVVSINGSDKDRFGLGAAVNRSTESLWDQRGGADLYKVEATHLVNQNLFASFLVSLLDSDFNLDPRGGAEAEIYIDPDGIWQGSHVKSWNSRDARQLRLSSSYFFHGGGPSHELQAELDARTFRLDGAERFGPRNLLHIAGENNDGVETLEALRPGPFGVDQDYRSLWIQDTIGWRHTTLKAGLRYDRQTAENLQGTVLANPVFPELLPEVDFPGRDAGFEWSMLSPRLGISHSLGDAGSTLLRAGYSRYPSQLYSDLALRVALPYWSGAVFEYDDLDGDHVFDPGEPHTLLNTFGVDASDPAAVESANVNDAGLEPETTDELTFGIEHTPTSQLVLGLDVTYRTITRIFEGRRLVETPEGKRVAEATDFVLDGIVEGDLPRQSGVYKKPFFSLREGLHFTGGSVLTNGDRQQDYTGVTLRFRKRMANQWMMRGHLTFSDWTWELGPEFVRFDDPTDSAIAYGEVALVSNADSAGDIVAEPPRGDLRDGVFINSRWQFDLSALYQLAPLRPWGFNVAAHVHGREGFPGPYRVVVVPGDNLVREVQVTDRSDDFRLDDIVLADVRIEKEFRIGRTGTVVSLDVFNAFNEGFVLERSLQLNGPQPDYLRETVSPRVMRLGVRFALD